MKITRSCGESTSVGMSAVGSYLYKKSKVISECDVYAKTQFKRQETKAALFYRCYLFISHVNTSATKGKFGVLKFSMDISL